MPRPPRPQRYHRLIIAPPLSSDHACLLACQAAFIAVASAPKAGSPFEFLVKEQPPSEWSPGTGWLTGASAGAAIEMSQVMGAGFLKTDDALKGVTDVICFAAGSGISPIRATIESGALSDCSVKLFYGCQTPETMSYADKFAEWKKLGVDVRTHSQRRHERGRACLAMRLL